jgi:hypothetical protein
MCLHAWVPANLNRLLLVTCESSLRERERERERDREGGEGGRERDIDITSVQPLEA